MKPDLDQCVEEFIERRDQGEKISPEAFAKQYPHLESKILFALEQVAQTESLFPESGLMIPKQVGPYNVLSELGQGGMGQVLLVEKESKQFALKLLSLSAQINRRSVRRFQREGQILLQLNQEGIVRVYDVGVFEGRPFLVMEYVKGATLDRFLKENVYSPMEAARLVERLARAVGALHQLDLLHRDIKPSNIILLEKNKAVLVDFGLAAAKDAPTLTKTGDIIGTPHYMSPEQARGEKVGPRSDVYALGCVLYELLAGRRPHAGKTSAQVLEAVRRKPIIPLRRIHKNIPKPLAVVVERALAYRKKDRYSSAQALAHDLQAFLWDRPIQARPNRMGRLLHSMRYRFVFMAPALAILITLGFSFLFMKTGDQELTLRRALDRAVMGWAANDLEDVGRAARAILEMDPSHAEGEFLLHLSEGDLMVDSQSAAVDDLIAGMSNLRAGRPQSAIKRFQRALRKSPDSPLPVIMLGRALKEAGDQKQREKELKQAIKSQPESAALYREMGVSLFQQERYVEADKAITRAIELSPDHAPLYLELAQSRLYSQGVQEGLMVAREAATRFNDKAPLNKFAVLASHKNKHQVARDLWFECLKEDPKNVQIHHHIATSYDSEEKLFKAKEWYEKTLDLDPDHLMTLIYLAHLHAGANSSTCKHCREFFKAHPEMYDPLRVENLLIRSVGVHKGERLNLLFFAVDKLKTVGRKEKLEETLREILKEADTAEKQKNIRYALKKL